MKYKIAFVGRPNVGKSTLFNRLSIDKKAIVHDRPGVTRDRKYSDARVGEFKFIAIDTPGLEEAEEGKLEHRMMQQTITAIREADLVCLVIDNQTGITPTDKFFADMIRKNHSNYIVIVNKTEKTFIYDKEYHKLGFGTPVPISAEHGQGMAYLYEAFMEKLDMEQQSQFIDPLKSNALHIVVAGRPNAGKSTFINAIIGEERLLTGKEAGITRESIEVSWEYKGNAMKLIDTAGLRKRSNVTKTLEKLSTSDTTASIRFANIVVLMLDATMALESQDINIGNYVIDEGRSIVIVVNKWDLVKDKKKYQEEFEYQINKLLPQIKDVPVVYISAIDGQQTDLVLDACIEIYKLWNRRITTSKLNDWLPFVINQHPLPLHKKLGRRVRIKYITQIKTRPPTFKLFSNDPESIPDSYKKYLLNSLRHDFGMPGVPIRLYFVKSDNPYEKSKK